MEQLNGVIQRHGRSPENLIQILVDYQSEKNDNCITDDEARLVARELEIPESHIYSIVTFYSFFSTKKRGKYVIQICDDVPCHVNGAFNAVKEFEDKLKISMGETTPDGVFTLEYTSCIGCCNMSPAVRIGGEIYGNLTPDMVGNLIDIYRRKYNECRE
jgi:NADH-quinone oxidoreductase subunit E